LRPVPRATIVGEALETAGYVLVSALLLVAGFAAVPASRWAERRRVPGPAVA
jgi:hypothetical protein